MKLTEPQKRVLRTMVEFVTHVELSLSETYAYYTRRDLGATIPDPAASTMGALERRNLVDATRKWGDHTFYTFTPKGREVAKELRDD